MSDAQGRTAAVVVTWNRKELLRQCIGRLLAQDGASCDILVVDNASTDGTKEMLDQEFSLPNVKHLNTGSNLGGAGGFQVGIEWAAREGYDYIWIMDDDCLPESGALFGLLEADTHLSGNWGWLCSAIYWIDGNICAFNRPKKDVFRHISPEDYRLERVPVKMTSFVSVMFNAKAVENLGLPIAEYFIWTDDYEYTGRISKEYPCYVVPSSKVVHAMKANARPSLAIEDASRIERFYYLSRNDVHCYRQHGVMGRAYLAAKFAYTAADVIVHAKDSKRKRLSTLTRGIRDGITFKPKTLMLSQKNKHDPYASTLGNLIAEGDMPNFERNAI